MDVMSGIQSLMMSHGITLVVGHSTEGRPQGGELGQWPASE